MAESTMEEAKETVEDVGSNGSESMARKLLIPAAAGIGTLAATVAARKAPDLVRNHLMPKLEERGGEEAAKVGKKAASQLQGGGGALGAVAGKAGEKLGSGGREKTRRLPIQRWTDVAVPIATAYDHWTKFEDFPKFMHRVVNIEEQDDEHLAWEEKIWFSTRRWEGEITDRRKNDRIAWKTTSGTAHAGIVSFHRLDDKLTRVMVTVDFRPSGMIEKLASGLRFVKRAVEADLARFKAYVEMAETEGLEYEQVPGDDEKKESDDGSDSNGSKSSASSNADAEGSREERAERRQQRRS